MLSSSNLFTYVSRYGVGKYSTASDLVSYETYLGECRRFINDKRPKEYFNWSNEKQVLATESLIIDFVNINMIKVEGFLNDEGQTNLNLVIDALKKSILDFGILGKALEDEEIQEIQINDKDSIWVVRKGKTELYRDNNGNPYRFVSNDELGATIYRMSYNPTGTTKRMTTENPLLNTRATKSGYRISGVNNSAITPDRPPFDFPVTSVTIRKYTSTRLTFEKLIEYNSLKPRMAKFLKCIARSDTRIAFVGPTSSGKTTLLNAEAWELPPEDRVILIQNPTEIMLYERDNNGTNVRNSLHWEAEDIPDNEVTDTKPTMSNFIAHALRNTPDIIVPGEARRPAEFREVYRAILTGHRVLLTYHADDSIGAIERFANELATDLGGNKNDYIGSISMMLDCIVSQYKLTDGTRKIMEISVPTGKLDSSGTPIINKLFEFRLDKKSEVDENGRVTKVLGKFYQVGVLGEDSKLANKLYKAGFNEDDLKEFFDENNVGVEL